MEEIELSNLAKRIVNQSLQALPKENVLIRYKSLDSNILIKYLIREIHNIGATAFLKFQDVELDSVLKETYNENSVPSVIEVLKVEYEQFDCFISIGYNSNDYENNKIVKNLNVNKIAKGISSFCYDQRGIILNFPSKLDAYKAKMKYEDYCDYYLSIMNYDYSLLREKMKELKKVLDRTSQVSIIGKDTDLHFMKTDINSVILCGERNIPDGEIYTAPIRNSVNGYITYNVPTKYKGNVFNKITLEFKHGRIVDFSSDNDERLKNILDIDKGSRYIGEFALGVNPLIFFPICDILHDEKIYGSFHLTLGQSYKDAYNGNDSAIHWDLISIQRDDYGGGNIYFDDNLIRQNGEFIPEYLQNLNNIDIKKLIKR